MAAFNTDKFLSAAFEPRTEFVPVPALAEFFEAGEEPRFEVRGVTASELQRAIEAGTRQSAVDGVVKAIAAQADQVEAIRKTLGLSTKDTPGEVAKRIELLVHGCVSPKFNHATAVKLAEAFPLILYDVTNRITNLTGQGGSRVKPQPSSSETQQSSEASSSAS